MDVRKKNRHWEEKLAKGKKNVIWKRMSSEEQLWRNEKNGNKKQKLKKK